MELVQNSLFENNSSSEIISKKFIVKDVFFNNGIVNLYQFLQENDFDIEISFEKNHLELKYFDENVYFDILNKFLKDKKIVSFNEKNKRIFFDLKQKEFIQSNKINIKNGGSNDSKNSLIRVHIDELGISQKELLKNVKRLLKC